MPAIEVDSLNKNYLIRKRKKGIRGAVADFFRPETYVKETIRDITFTVEKGGIVGLIGPNGAGKSSLIKILVGILKPDSGRVRVIGMEPFTQRQNYACKIGVVFGQRSPLWWDLPVSDSFELLRRIYKVPDGEYKASHDYLIETFELQRLLTQPVRMLSLGQKLRCTIAAAMLHSPDILFLDEPTIGLDILMTDQMLLIFKKMNTERKTTIFITSHDLNVVERLCQEMILLHDGRILYHGGVSAAISRFVRNRRLRITSYEKGCLQALTLLIPPQCKIESLTESSLVLLFEQETLSFNDLVTFLQSGVSAVGMSDFEFFLEKPDLNDLILTVFNPRKKNE